LTGAVPAAALQELKDWHDSGLLPTEVYHARVNAVLDAASTEHASRSLQSDDSPSGRFSAVTVNDVCNYDINDSGTIDIPDILAVLR
jgi:hypothetical protein